ncbi:MAG: hypothetical protein MUP64_16095, partial [Anaerolineae bacterium]|nr:hypothetical protein [Anaerolineae bacterium]
GGSDRGRRRARAAADTTRARASAYNGTREWMCRCADIHVLHGLCERNQRGSAGKAELGGSDQRDEWPVGGVSGA